MMDERFALLRKKPIIEKFFISVKNGNIRKSNVINVSKLKKQMIDIKIQNPNLKFGLAIQSYKIQS